MNVFRCKPVVLFDPRTSKAVSFGSQAAASKYLRRDPSTVSRAVTGDRGIISVKGYVATAIPAVRA